MAHYEWLVKMPNSTHICVINVKYFRDCSTLNVENEHAVAAESLKRFFSATTVLSRDVYKN